VLKLSCSAPSMMLVDDCLWSKVGCEFLLGCGIVRVVFELRPRWALDVVINSRRLLPRTPR
jgi:hypothetical protein